MDNLLSLLLEPIKQFLISQGVWDELVALWETVSELFTKLTASLGVEMPGDGSVWDFVVSAFKLIVNIFVTLIKVLIDIANWIIGLVS
jgi:hypothetical protein